MTSQTVMSASSFRKKWKMNFLRVQSGEDICITRYGKVQGIMKTNLDECERAQAKLKLKKYETASTQF
jgi:hypothetical protein